MLEQLICLSFTKLVLGINIKKYNNIIFDDQNRL